MAGVSPRPGTIIEGINVTPLVDIMMVLLVIFILRQAGLAKVAFATRAADETAP